MGKVRRNEPCPCGSGRKYKLCCLAHEDQIVAADRDDERVWRRIQDWARERHPDELRRAVETFAGPSREVPEAQIDLMCSWVHLDYELPGGGSFAERYALGQDLVPGEREVATQIAAARLDLHRVLAVARGHAIELESVTRGSKIRVRSLNVSRHAVTWDLVLGRVMEGKPEPSLWGPAAFYDPNEEPELLGEFERLARELGVSADATGFDAVFRTSALDLLRFVPPSRSIEPVFVSVEGDPAAHAVATWEVADNLEALAALDTPPELVWMGPDSDRDCFVWALPRREVLRGRARLPRGALVLECTPVAVGEEPPPELKDRIAVGSFELEGDELNFMALSKPRLEAACALVERRLGRLASLVRREVTDLDSSWLGSEHAEAPLPAPSDPPLPAGEVRQLVEAQVGRRYRRMLDEPHARLGGLTPREAASSAEHTAELTLLVRGIENHAERERRRGQAFPDVTWMRGELGIDDARAA